MIGPAGDVIVEQPLHGLGPKESPRLRLRIEEDLPGEVPHLVPEPMIQGNAKTHLPPPADRRRQQVGKGLQQDPLALPPAELQAHRHAGRQLDHAMIEKRLPAFQPEGHRSRIDLGHQIAGQIGQQVGQAHRGHGIAAVRTQ